MLPIRRSESDGELFGARLRELREQRGESQRSLAELTGSTHAYISQMERGLKVPTLTMIIRLAVALDCEVAGRDLRKIIPKRK